MKSAQFRSYGGPEVIEIDRDAALPPLGGGQVLVECHAASINPVDSFLRAGYMQKMMPLAFPVTVAGDFAGEVKQLGPGVADINVGANVYGMAAVFSGGSGAAAEYVVASAGSIAQKPGKASFYEAASLPLAGVSAVQALESSIKLTPGQRVLIHGGAGGVGSIAIQYAKHIGCFVATTVRGSQKEFASKLGADLVVDFEVEQFEGVLRDYDAVLDTVGGEVYRRSFQILKKGGVVATMVQNPSDQELMSKFGVRSVYVGAQANRASLSHLSELVDAGVIKAQIDREFPLEMTREAYAYFETGHPKGKVVIRVK